VVPVIVTTTIPRTIVQSTVIITVVPTTGANGQVSSVTRSITSITSYVTAIAAAGTSIPGLTDGSTLNKKSGLSTGAIAGIGVGVGLAAILAIAGLLTWWMRKRRMQESTVYSGFDDLHGTAENGGSGFGTLGTAAAVGGAAGMASAGTSGGHNRTSTMTQMTDSSLHSSLQKSPIVGAGYYGGGAGRASSPDDDPNNPHPGPHPQYPFIAGAGGQQYGMLHPTQQAQILASQNSNSSSNPQSHTGLTPSPLSNPGGSPPPGFQPTHNAYGQPIYEAPSDDGRSSQAGYSPPNTYGNVVHEAPSGPMHNMGYQGTQSQQPIYEVPGADVTRGTQLGPIQEMGSGEPAQGGLAPGGNATASRFSGSRFTEGFNSGGPEGAPTFHPHG
jgi:hypothetical protein